MNTAYICQRRALTSAENIYLQHQDMFPSIQMASPMSCTSTTTASSQFPFRESSPKSSDAQPLCPPALIRKCVALPSQSGGGREAVLHPKLECQSYRTGAPYTQWDLSKSFEDVDFTSRSDRSCIPPYFVELATQPPLPSITVVHPLLPWCITVHRSGIDGRGVTIVDVLCAIYAAVRVKAEKELGGKMRLEYLQGKKMLLGLTRSQLGGDVWEMVVV